MPKTQPFDINNYEKHEQKQILRKLITEKCTMTLYGIQFTPKLDAWYNLPEGLYKAFQESSDFLPTLKAYYEKQKAAKVKEYEDLKKITDHCLHDLPSYKKLLKELDNFTYCGAITELQEIKTKYLKGRAASKAKYRARLQELNNLKC